MGQGGSIPFMNFLKNEKFPTAKFIITGLLGPDSNAHGPNECLEFNYLRKLTACFAQLIAKSIPVFFPEGKNPSKDTHHHGNHHVHKGGKAQYHL
jgi:hypothetical protein